MCVNILCSEAGGDLDEVKNLSTAKGFYCHKHLYHQQVWRNQAVGTVVCVHLLVDGGWMVTVQLIAASCNKHCMGQISSLLHPC